MVSYVVYRRIIETIGVISFNEKKDPETDKVTYEEVAQHYNPEHITWIGSINQIKNKKEDKVDVYGFTIKLLDQPQFWVEYLTEEAAKESLDRVVKLCMSYSREK